MDITRWPDCFKCQRLDEEAGRIRREGKPLSDRKDELRPGKLQGTARGRSWMGAGQGEVEPAIMGSFFGITSIGDADKWAASLRRNNYPKSCSKPEHVCMCCSGKR